VFAIIHSVLSTSLVKRGAQRLMKGSFKYYRLLYSIIAFATLAWVLHIHFSIQEIILWLTPWYEKWLAALMILGGVVVMAICIKKYFLYLSGIDVFLDEQQTPVLEQTGLHAYVRHPLYAGTLLFVWGIFVGYPYTSNLISCACITIYTLIGIYFEEKKLVREYGAVYLEYRKKVPMLIPGL